MQILIERGADVNAPFLPEQLPAIPFKELVKQCPTALHLAADRGDLELVKVRRASATSAGAAACLASVNHPSQLLAYCSGPAVGFCGRQRPACWLLHIAASSSP